MENKQKEETILVDKDISTEPKNSVEEETKEINIKKDNTKIVIIFSIIVFFIVAYIISAFLTIKSKKENKIIKGIFVSDIEVSNLSKEEAEEKINKKIEEELNKELTLYYKEKEIKIILSDLQPQYNVNEIVEEAFEIAKTGNIIKDTCSKIYTSISKRKIDFVVKINENILYNMIGEIEENIPNKMVESGYYIEGQELIIKKGTPGETIEKEKLLEDVLSHIKEFEFDKKIEIIINYKEPGKIDVEKIYKEVYNIPVDAYCIEEPFCVVPETNGVDFAITLEEAQQLVKEEKQEYIIPLTITKPEITIKDIGNAAFPDLLATFSTKYSEKSVNRTTNLKLASDKIDETVLMPGEIFSYNQVVGERTASAGYKDAPIFQGGKVIDGIGGGICQISSTLYNSVLLSNLEIVDRRNHGFTTSYVSPGKDATVSYGTLDFKFKNSRQHPIIIQSEVIGGIATVSIYGIKEEVEYEVIIEANKLSTIGYGTKYEDDPNLEIGKEKVIQSGSSGCKTETYRILKLNGQEISRQLLSKDTYNAMQRIVKRGTKNVTTNIETPKTPDINIVSETPKVTKPEVNNIETNTINNIKNNTSTSNVQANTINSLINNTI